MPRVRTHLLLARRVDQAQAAPLVAGIDLLVADGMDQAMLAMAAEQGLDEPWCAEQLQQGGRCVLAVAHRDSGPVSVGMGMVAFGRFWVEEIAHWFDPGADGCYLYATFVRPEYRGRRIQSLLDDRRMQLARQQGRRWAYSLVESDNAASLRGHQAGGFHAVGRIDSLCWRGPMLTSIRRISASRPAGRFDPPAAGRWFSLRPPMSAH